MVLGQLPHAPGVQFLSAPRRGPRIVERIHHEVKPRDLVQHCHVEGRGGRSVLDEASYMEAISIRAAVHQLMYRTRKAVEGEDDIHGVGEELGEVGGRHPVRVVDRARKRHQVHDIDDAYLQIRQLLSQNLDRSDL